MDSNANGLYNDYIWEGEWNADRLLLDINGDGRLDGRYRSEEATEMSYVRPGS